MVARKGNSNIFRSTLTGLGLILSVHWDQCHTSLPLFSISGGSTHSLSPTCFKVPHRWVWGSSLWEQKPNSHTKPYSQSWRAESPAVLSPTLSCLHCKEIWALHEQLKDRDRGKRQKQRTVMGDRDSVEERQNGRQREKERR